MSKEPFTLDVADFIDKVFGVAEKVTEKMYSEMEKSLQRHKESADYYPGYSYPPMNVYICKEKSIVFEMALAGFSQNDLTLHFQGNYMFFSAVWNQAAPPEEARWLKKRLKSKSILEQKYFVPADKFDQSLSKASFTNGLLKITIPAREIAAVKEDLHLTIQG